MAVNYVFSPAPNDQGFGIKYNPDNAASVEVQIPLGLK